MRRKDKPIIGRGKQKAFPLYHLFLAGCSFHTVDSTPQRDELEIDRNVCEMFIVEVIDYIKEKHILCWTTLFYDIDFKNNVVHNMPGGCLCLCNERRAWGRCHTWGWGRVSQIIGWFPHSQSSPCSLPGSAAASLVSLCHSLCHCVTVQQPHLCHCSRMKATDCFHGKGKEH